MMAAQHGKHVAVEKPVAGTILEIHEAYDACEANGVELFCSFQRRADAAYSAVARYVHDGFIGQVASVHCTFRDHPTPATEFLAAPGGCIFSDLLVHDADFVRWLLDSDPCGSDIVSVSAHGATFSRNLEEAKKEGTFDFATVLLVFRSGCVATFDLSRHSAYGYDQRVEVFGSNGCRVAVTNPPSASWESSGATEASAMMPPLMHSFPERFAAAFDEEAMVFGSIVRSGT